MKQIKEVDVEYTWRNIVAFPVWQCKVCGKLIVDRWEISRHMAEEHHIHVTEVFDDAAYSPDFEFPNVKEVAAYHNAYKAGYQQAVEDARIRLNRAEILEGAG